MSTQQEPRNDVVRAVRAVKRLLDDPDDLPQVFTVIESLPGGSPGAMRRKLEATEEGRRLLQERPDIVPLLRDRARLRAMPEGSLAHAYLAFVESENIGAEGLLAAAAEGEAGALAAAGEVLRWQHERMRDTHDLWHAVTGYRGDVLGELSLLAFNLGQNWHPGIALMVAAALARGLSRDDTWLVLEGYARGRRAMFLPGVRWEDWLHRPLAEVREELRVSGPPPYRPVRTSELRAMGKVAAPRAA